MPQITLKNTDQNWVLALAGEVYANDRDNAIRELAELLLRTKIEAARPDLNSEELGETVSVELYDLVATSRSDSDMAEVVGAIRDRDSDFDLWLFGENGDYVDSILSSDHAIRKVAESAYFGYRDFLSIHPERVPATFEGGIWRHPPPENEEELERCIVDDLADMIRDRRNDALSKLIQESFPRG
jgi:hypothetical protein